jgi:hypothetical protein
MSKLTIGQDGKIYWRDDALSVDTVVRAFNERAEQIRKLEIENATLTGKLAAMECFPAPTQATRWPTPEDAAKYRQDWLAERHNWARWEEFRALHQSEHTSAMAALFDWIRGGCLDE